MTDKPINLNIFRKAKALEEKEIKASENRTKNGEPKVRSELEAARQKRRKDKLDAHKIEDD